MKDYEPSPYFVWSVHLDGDKEDHDKSVCQAGTYDRAVAAIKAAKAKGFRCNINCTLFNNADPERMAKFFDTVMAMGVDGITVSPGYAYERAPDQQHFLNRGKTKQLFRDIFSRGNGGKNWSFSQSGLFLDFLAGNQEYHCTPWGNPTRTVFGWQRPCYLLGEGYTKTFKELMEGTDWDAYGTGNYEKCADCMVHSGYEATAVQDTFKHPLKALGVEPARRRRPRARWRRKSRSIASGRRNTCSRATSSRSSPKFSENKARSKQAHSRVGFCHRVCYRESLSHAHISGKRGPRPCWKAGRGSRVWATMNARKFAALAITAGLLAFAAEAAQAADDPFAQFRRQLVGQRHHHRPGRSARAHPLPRQQQRRMTRRHPQL